MPIDLDRVRSLLQQVLESLTNEPPLRPDDPPLCTPVRLPRELQVRAAQTAVTHNPVNHPRLASMPSDVVQQVISDPLAIAMVTSKYWGPAQRQLTVSFLDTTVPIELRQRILSHMNAWACGITFVLTPQVGQVRVSLAGSGYWSYIGTDILHIAPTQPTMNLQGFSMNTPESEFKRVIRHEAGHSIGFPHEHARKEIVARIDREKAYRWFQLVYGWDKATVDAQVLTPLEESSIMGTPSDVSSIMCYQLPRSITVDNQPITGGIDINATDKAFALKVYPLTKGCGCPSAAQAAATVAPKEADFLTEPLALEG